MKKQIEIALRKIEEENEIKILLAVESGSRAWGFASTDSDWDVRFIYVHKPSWYLSIDDKKDNIEQMLPGELDVAGWELRKTLKLFRKSNPPLLEWLLSPIIYIEQYSTAKKLRGLLAEYFNAKSCTYHYLSMAKRNFKHYLQKDFVRTKKYFYVLRPILACKWIEQTNTMPPMEFQKLIGAQVFDARLLKEINNLLDRKIKGEELNEGPQIQILNEYLKKEIEHFEQEVKEYPGDIKPLTDKLDKLFRATLEEVWN